VWGTCKTQRCLKRLLSSKLKKGEKMKWNDPNLTAGAGGGKFYKFTAGENVIRIVSETEVIAKHYINDKYSVCVGKDKDCEGCKQNNKAKAKWLCWVIDRTDGSFKLVELPYTVTKALGELANSSQYGFEVLPPYDITVKKTGEGLDTEYTVIADRQDSALTEEEETEKQALKSPILIVEEMKTKGETSEIEPF
jgi:hypothetical protein